MVVIKTKSGLKSEVKALFDLNNDYEKVDRFCRNAFHRGINDDIDGASYVYKNFKILKEARIQVNYDICYGDMEVGSGFIIELED